MHHLIPGRIRRKIFPSNVNRSATINRLVKPARLFSSSSSLRGLHVRCRYVFKMLRIASKPCPRSHEPMSFSVHIDFDVRNAVRRVSRMMGLVALGTGLLLTQASGADANSKYSGFVIDANNGHVLYADRADELRYPASLTKMMTLYLTFDSLSRHRISLDDQDACFTLRVATPAVKAWRCAGLQHYRRRGNQFPGHQIGERCGRRSVRVSRWNGGEVRRADDSHRPSARHVPNDLQECQRFA